MRTPRAVILTATLCVCLALVACTNGTSTTGNATSPTTKSSAPTAAPTATVTKPTSVPLTDMAFCQHILSISEANQFMNPPTPATTIIPNNTANGGSCTYSYGSQPQQITLTVVLQPYTGPVPLTQQDINTFVTQALSEAGVNGITVNSLQMVSGVGDQAAFVSITTPNSIISKVTVFYVLYGKIWFDCVNYFDVGSSSDAAQMSGLQQCAQTVVSRL